MPFPSLFTEAALLVSLCPGSAQALSFDYSTLYLTHAAYSSYWNLNFSFIRRDSTTSLHEVTFPNHHPPPRRHHYSLHWLHTFSFKARITVFGLFSLFLSLQHFIPSIYFSTWNSVGPQQFLLN